MYLIVFSIRVTATVLGQDAALAVQDVAGVALAALHAVVAAVALEPDGGAARLAQGHAALVVAVGGTADGCDVQGEHEGCRLAPWRKLTSPTSSLHHRLPASISRGAHKLHALAMRTAHKPSGTGSC